MKEIFTVNDDFRKTAYLNWRISKHSQILNLRNIADGNMQSALILAKNCVLNNKHKKADIVIFPILTNVNHGIELYLKALIRTLNILLKNGLTPDGGHDIRRLLKTVQVRIEEFNGHSCLIEFNNDFRSLIEYVDELFALITSEKKDNMDFSRYSISNKGKNHFYVESIENVTIDLPNFIKRFKRIHKSFDKWIDYLYFDELKQND